MQLTARHLVALLIVCGSLFLAVFLAKDFGAYAGIVGVAGGIAGVLYPASGPSSGMSIDALSDAVRRAARAEPLPAPAGSSSATLKIYQELNRFPDAVASQRETQRRAAAEIREAVQVLDDLMERLGDGVTTQLSASEAHARSI